MYKADRSQATERHRVLESAHDIVKTNQALIKNQGMAIENILHNQDIVVASTQQQELLLQNTQESVALQTKILTGLVKSFSE